MTSQHADRICLQPYDRTYLDLSWEWLRDPEIKALTLTPDFTRDQQQAFFASLAGREDYKIWGVATATGEKIGAAGIKHISGKRGEVWLYIGKREWWGSGVGGRILELCEAKGQALGIERLDMVADANNRRSVRAFEKMGFSRDETAVGGKLVQLSKVITA